MSSANNRLGRSQSHSPSRGLLPKVIRSWIQRGVLVEGACALSLTLLVLVVFAQVVARYVFSVPLTWSQEAISFSFAWACFLGAAIAVKYRGHIIVDFVVDRFPTSLRKLVVALTGLSVVSFCLLLTYSGYEMVLVSHGQNSPALDLPLSVTYASLPVSSALMAYYECKHLWAVWRGHEVGSSFLGARDVEAVE